MIVVTLTHPDGQRQDVLLAAVPPVGSRVRLSNGLNQMLVVEQLLFVEGSDERPEPAVFVSVRPQTGGPM